jgi:hypothetical protein
MDGALDFARHGKAKVLGFPPKVRGNDEVWEVLTRERRAFFHHLGRSPACMTVSVARWSSMCLLMPFTVSCTLTEAGYGFPYTSWKLRQILSTTSRMLQGRRAEARMKSIGMQAVPLSPPSSLTRAVAGETDVALPACALKPMELNTQAVDWDGVRPGRAPAQHNPGIEGLELRFNFVSSQPTTSASRARGKRFFIPPSAGLNRQVLG